MDSSNDNAGLPSATTAASSSTSAAAAASSSKTVSEHLAQTLHTLDQLTTIFSFPHHLAKLAIDTCGPEDITTCYNWILDNHSNEVEDCGGPVVPINDCPHINNHVKFAIIDDKMQLIDSTDISNNGIANDTNNSGSMSRSSSLTNYCQEFTNLCCIDETSDIMTAKCQYYNECNMKNKRIGSRKRLRSEDEKERIGQLKCEEDYEEDTCTKVAGKEKQLSCPIGENWICLECGALMCSRYANGHAKLHYEDTKEEENAAAAAADGGEVGGEAVGHCIAVSLADLSVWCYECNAYLHHPKLNVLTKHLEKIKFGKDEVDESGAAKNGEDDETGASKIAIESSFETTAKPSPINKRKSQPRKLPPEQIGTDVMVSSTQPLPNQKDSEDNDNNDKKMGGNQSESINSDDSRVDEINSSDDESDEQAAMIASLLQSEHGEALRAYLARFESYDTSDMGQCVPMNMPKPPTFPDEVADFLQSPMCKSIIVLAGAGMSVR